MTAPAARKHKDAYKAIFGALAHPARRRVLLTVYFSGGAMTAGEIAAMFAHAWQTTTRHLQVLEAAGLLTHKKQGRKRVYRIEAKRLALVGEWLAHFQNPVRRGTGGRNNVGKAESKKRKAKTRIGQRRATVFQAQRRGGRS